MKKVIKRSLFVILLLVLVVEIYLLNTRTSTIKESVSTDANTKLDTALKLTANSTFKDGVLLFYNMKSDEDREKVKLLLKPVDKSLIETALENAKVIEGEYVIKLSSIGYSNKDNTFDIHYLISVKGVSHITYLVDVFLKGLFENNEGIYEFRTTEIKGY